MRFALANRGEMLELIAEEEYLAEMPFWMGFDLGDAIQHRPLEIELHHDTKGLRQSRVHGYRKIEGAELSVLDQPRKRRQRLAESVVGVRYRVVAFGGRAEGALHDRAVVEQGEEHGDSLHNGGAQLRLDSLPVLVEPPLYGIELFLFVLRCRRARCLVQNLERNVLALQHGEKPSRTLGLVVP